MKYKNDYNLTILNISNGDLKIWLKQEVFSRASQGLSLNSGFSSVF